MSLATLTQFAQAVADGSIRTVDLTQMLSEDTPLLVLPEPFGQTAAFSREEISRYDERGVAWYWSNFTVGEHTGTHFDAPIHWVTGKDLPANTVDAIAPQDFIAPAVVIDCSAECAADPDFVLTRAVIEAWEAKHGRIPPRSWVLFRTDWSKRDVDAYTNRREDGAHTPGPDPEACRFLIEERDAHGFGVETIGELLVMPRAQLVRRFGGAIVRRLDQATGAAAEPIVADTRVAPIFLHVRARKPL